MNLKKNRGQVSAIDALVAFVIFSITFALFLNFQQQQSISNNSVYSPTFLQAQKVSYLLTYGQGIPSNWNSTNVIQLGLSDSPGLIDSTKLNNLNLMTYDQVRQSLGALNYDLSIEVYYPNNSIIFNYQPIIPNNPSYFTPITTPVIYNGQVALLRVSLWQ